MLEILVVVLVAVGVFVGCTVSSVDKPRDVSQPDQCDPKGPCNVGKKPGVSK